MSAASRYSRVYAVDRREVVIPFVISAFCHITLFAALILVPQQAVKRPLIPAVIDVRMVTLPTAQRHEKAAAPARQPATVAAPRPAPKDAVSIADHKKPAPAASDKPAPVKPKVSLKHRTYQSAEVVRQAVERIEKDVEENRPDTVAEAIDRLKEQVDKQPAPSAEAVDAAKRLGIATDGSADSKDVLDLIDIYRVEVAFEIQKNWAFSESLAGSADNLVAEVAFTVMPNGEIRDIWFDKRSGNDYLDESARRAIMKSNPVKPHPPGVIKPQIIVGLRFTPKGVLK